MEKTFVNDIIITLNVSDVSHPKKNNDFIRIINAPPDINAKSVYIR